MSFFTPRLCLYKVVDRLKTKDKNNYPKTNIITISAQIIKVIDDYKQFSSFKTFIPELFWFDSIQEFVHQLPLYVIEKVVLYPSRGWAPVTKNVFTCSATVARVRYWRTWVKPVSFGSTGVLQGLPATVLLFLGSDLRVSGVARWKAYRTATQASWKIHHWDVLCLVGWRFSSKYELAKQSSDSLARSMACRVVDELQYLSSLCYFTQSVSITSELIDWYVEGISVMTI